MRTMVARDLRWPSSQLTLEHEGRSLANQPHIHSEASKPMRSRIKAYAQMCALRAKRPSTRGIARTRLSYEHYRLCDGEARDKGMVRSFFFWCLLKLRLDQPTNIVNFFFAHELIGH